VQAALVKIEPFQLIHYYKPISSNQIIEFLSYCVQSDQIGKNFTLGAIFNLEQFAVKLGYFFTEEG
jgi:hypothetical protein